MVGRYGLMLVSLFAFSLVVCDQAAAQPRLAVGRPGIYEVGEPFSISRSTLAQELRRNDELRLYVNQYGWPDYAEIQEVLPQWPWADYEVRLYYLDRELALAFGRVFLSSEFPNYGMKKSLQKIRPEVLDRLLTARPIAGQGAVPVPPAASQEYLPPRELGPTNKQLEQSQPALEPPAADEGESVPDVQIETHTDGSAPAKVVAQQ